MLYVMISFSLFIEPVYSQIFESDEIRLFVPEKMIAGETYQGMITLLSPSSQNLLAIIKTDNDFILNVDSSVNIDVNQNHGIFNITPLHEGTTDIFVSLDGELASATTTVYSQKSGPQKLKIILPGNSTLANDLKGFVFLLDGNGSPVKSESDITVNLSSTEKIVVPPQVTIFNGTTNASFGINVRSSGDISAIASGLDADSATIQKIQETIDVKMAIAPNIIKENTPTNYFIWLEKDRKPYSTPNSLKIEISSSNTDVIRLEKVPSSYKNDNTIITSMTDGITTGTLYAGSEGVAEIFVSIQDYGHTSTIATVGPVVLVEGEIIEEDVLSERVNIEPNHIQFWVYPDVTDDVAYGVAALYYTETTETLDVTLGKDDIQITNLVDHTTLIPVKSADSLITISSESGLKHDSNYMIDDTQFPSNSKVFEIIAEDVGEYIITATGGKSSDTANLKVVTNYNSQYSILTTTLPVLTDNTQPLLMVSIIDENQNIVDISEAFGFSLYMDAYSDNSKIGSSVRLFDDNVGVVSGMLNGISSITLSSEKLGPVSESLTPSGVPVSIEFLTPDNVHAGEPFAVAIHTIDAEGIPIYKISTQSTTSSGFDKIDEGIISISGINGQQISILAQIGGAFQKHIDSFTNTISFDVEPIPENVRIGKPLTIIINSPFDGIEYSIDSPFPYEKIDENTFSVIPGHEVDDAIITIFGKLDGFNTLSKQMSFSSENIVEISTMAKTPEGHFIFPEYDIVLSDGIENRETPYTHSIKPQQIVVTFPNDWNTASSGYKLVDLKLDDSSVNGNQLDFFADSDRTITAIYDRFVQITVIDGKGSGIYPYGENIKISAPDKQKISFLVMEKFDYWIGIDKSTSSFTVKTEKDIEITAIYKDDYTILMGMILAIVIAFVILVIKKGDSAYIYHLEEIIEKITSLVKPLIPKIKK